MPTKGVSGPPNNNLLRHLRDAELALILPHLALRRGAVGDVLYNPGDMVETVYFPCGPSLVSFVIDLAEGKGVETVLVGREGAVGGIVSEGHLPAFARCMVQSAGDFMALETARLDELKQQSRAVAHVFTRYADCLMAQVFQSVACNAAHSIEQRTAKWLVAAIERTGEHDVPLTQEQLAGMLGVGRSYISRVLGRLKADGLLATRRGRLQVMQMPRLRGLSCECQDRVRSHFDRVLSGVYPTESESAALHRSGQDQTAQGGASG
ncbi:MAG: hypothetical protein RLZZ08_478 [Pseudomonadota bacterium]|jgi:CRP-like cAMP-binding protein